MAFEDRFSPDTAKSPNSASEVQQNSPESSRTSVYTCQVIHPNYLKEKNYGTNLDNMRQEPEKANFFRITSFALNNENSSSSSSSSSCEDSSLKYSIDNILQPDFGKSAILKTKTPICSKIAFKPYERQNSFFNNSISSSSSSSSSQSTLLNSLSQTVSQIGSNSLSRINITKDISKSDLLVNNFEEHTTKSISGDSVSSSKSSDEKEDKKDLPQLWPAWVYCTRYSDRPSSGPRSRRIKKPSSGPKNVPDEKRPRTAFSGAQLARLKNEFNENRYLTETRRQQLSKELGLNEAQIKIWFQNKRAKIKKASGVKNPLALQLMAQGLYNHSTVACDEDDMPILSPTSSQG